MTIYERIQNFEEENDLFDLSYRGLFFWPIIRMNIWMRVVCKGKNTHSDDYLKSKSKRDYLKIFFAAVQQCFYHSSTKSDILISVPPIIKEINGQLLNPFDYFLEDMPFSLQKFTIYSDWNTPRLADEKNNAILEMKLLFRKIHVKYFRKPPQALIDLIYEINQTFDMNFNEYEYAAYIVRVCSIMPEIQNYYEKFFQKHHYRAIYLICHYNEYHFALCAAAKKFNIPVIEYQHGVIGPYHLSYNFKNQDRFMPYFPDYLLTYGNSFNQSCHTPRQCKKIVVGNPIMDEARNFYKDTIKDNKKIVFYSSFECGHALSQLAVELAECAASQGYRIIYKLHPSECSSWQKYYPHLQNHEAITVIDTSISIYPLVAENLHHVSVSSTVLFEASAFDNCIYCYDFEIGREYMDEFVASGGGVRFSSAQELFELIQTATTPSQNIGTQYYASNSLFLLQKTLEQIINTQT